MRLRTQLITLGLLAALGTWSEAPAQAAELTIYLNQATESGVRELASAFEKASGHKVDVSFEGSEFLSPSIMFHGLDAINKADTSLDLPNDIVQSRVG